MSSQFEQLRAKAGHWTLAEDSQLCSMFEGFSQMLQQRTRALEERLGTMTRNITEIDVGIEAINGHLDLLASRQFVEQKISEDDQFRPINSDVGPMKTMQQNQTETIDSIKSAIRGGIGFVSGEIGLGRGEFNLPPMIGSVDFQRETFVLTKKTEKPKEIGKIEGNSENFVSAPLQSAPINAPETSLPQENPIDKKPQPIPPVPSLPAQLPKRSTLFDSEDDEDDEDDIFAQAKRHVAAKSESPFDRSSSSKKSTEPVPLVVEPVDEPVDDEPTTEVIKNLEAEPNDLSSDIQKLPGDAPPTNTFVPSLADVLSATTNLKSRRETGTAKTPISHFQAPNPDVQYPGKVSTGTTVPQNPQNKVDLEKKALKQETKAPEKKIPPTTTAAPVKKSIFDDSDSDSDLFTIAAQKVAASKAKQASATKSAPITVPETPLPPENPINKSKPPSQNAQKIDEKQKRTTVPPPPAAVPQEAEKVEKVAEKQKVVESVEKKPIKVSVRKTGLFDDSDSDDDLFSAIKKRPPSGFQPQGKVGVEKSISKSSPKPKSLFDDSDSGEDLFAKSSQSSKSSKSSKQIVKNEPPIQASTRIVEVEKSLPPSDPLAIVTPVTSRKEESPRKLEKAEAGVEKLVSEETDSTLTTSKSINASDNLLDHRIVTQEADSRQKEITVADLRQKGVTVEADKVRAETKDTEKRQEIVEIERVDAVTSRTAESKEKVAEKLAEVEKKPQSPIGIVEAVIAQLPEIFSKPNASVPASLREDLRDFPNPSTDLVETEPTTKPRGATLNLAVEDDQPFALPTERTFDEKPGSEKKPKSISPIVSAQIFDSNPPIFARNDSPPAAPNQPSTSVFAAEEFEEGPGFEIPSDPDLERSTDEMNVRGKLNNTALANKLNACLAKPPPPGGVRLFPPPPSVKSDEPSSAQSVSPIPAPSAIRRTHSEQAPPQSESKLFDEKPHLLSSTVKNRVTGPMRRPPSRASVVLRSGSSESESGNRAQSIAAFPSEAPVMRRNASPPQRVVRSMVLPSGSSVQEIEKVERKLSGSKIATSTTITSESPENKNIGVVRPKSPEKAAQAPPTIEPTPRKISVTSVSQSPPLVRKGSTGSRISITSQTLKSNDQKEEGKKKSLLFDSESSDDDFFKKKTVFSVKTTSGISASKPSSTNDPSKPPPAPAAAKVSTTTAKATSSTVKKSLFDDSDEDLDLFRKK